MDIIIEKSEVQQMKMDGHTHTQLCAHGSGEKTEKMIEKAIRLGFTDYCITEHAPLPAGFETSYEGPREGYETASLGFDQLEEYFVSSGVQNSEM